MTPPGSLALSPRGHVYLERGVHGDAAGAAVLPSEVVEAFAGGPASGLLRLGALDREIPLPPAGVFWREVARRFLARVAGIAAAGEPADAASMVPPAGLFDELATAAPPMTGGEYLSAGVLSDVWQGLAQELEHRAGRSGGIQHVLRELHPSWQLIGRVCFHLAEYPEDPETPFAFMATHITDVGAGGRARHVRLRNAVERQSRARDRHGLLALLAPVEKAATACPLIRDLLDSGAIYETPTWTAGEAYAFLKAVPLIEASGIIVRVPDWWSPERRPRVQVQVTIGGSPPGQVGLESLLDFTAHLAIEGTPLSEAEWIAARRQAEGLVKIKGRWVEIDAGKLAEVLSRWQAVQHAAEGGGITFGEGMRILAGAALGGGAGIPVSDVETRRWTGIEAGPWLATLLARLRQPGTAGAEDVPPEFQTVLRPYQRAGLKWLQLLYGLGLGGCLADDMGLGKTVQILAFWRWLQARGGGGTHLLVVPSSLLPNWQAELERFAPSLRMQVAHPSAGRLAALGRPGKAATDVVMTSYGYLHRLDWPGDVKWETIVLDEAQAIKNPATRHSRNVKALRSKARFALTGTPIENRLGDLWSLFDFLNPGLLGSARAFGGLIKGLRQAESAGYAPLRRLVQPYVLRRMKTDRAVIADLPAKTEMRTWCGLTGIQAALYQTAVEDLARQLRLVSDITRKGVVLKYLTRFKQICNHPSHWTGDGEFDPGHSGKFVRLRELVETIAARQEKVLVFTQFREMTEPLAAHLGEIFGRSGLVLHGATPVRRRAVMVAAFQAEDGPPFFVLSLKAGGVGLNLTEASHVIHFDRWWNPAVEDQATDRAFRIGQRRNVLVHKLVCRGTVEERIDALIAGKVALSRDVLSPDGAMALTEMTDRELIAFVGLDLTSALEKP